MLAKGWLGEGGGCDDRRAGVGSGVPAVTITYYQLLGIRPDASADEVKAAYRRSMKLVHSDRGGSDDQARLIIDAYEQLKDPQRRSVYDAALGGRAAEPAEHVRTPPPRHGPEPSWNVTLPVRPATWLIAGAAVWACLTAALVIMVAVQGNLWLVAALLLAMVPVLPPSWRERLPGGRVLVRSAWVAVAVLGVAAIAVLLDRQSWVVGTWLLVVVAGLPLPARLVTVARARRQPSRR